ncbi:MAG: prepilin-type N-terminal cleavage/methylation domain-containing protein [Candidatus Sumerlaeaceae bacterium]|nr:prepilin-type N-terminal cleavage/methylation domain-containing protein [Candidatus Sumerlaeaceae bacterium]
MIRRTAKGFTLVEIMIVVAIIGIIIAIAVPAFLRARENSRGRACQENLSKIDGAKEQYALEFNLSNGAGVSFSDLINPGGAADGEGFLKREPECPAGGTYTEGNIGAEPTCDIGSTNSPFEPHVIQN